MISNQTFQFGKYLLNSEQSTRLEIGDIEVNKINFLPPGTLILADDTEDYVTN